MSYIDSSLLPDEQIVFRTKKHWIIFFIPAVLAAMTVFFLTNSNPFVAKMWVVPAVGMVITLINQLLMYATSEFAITSKRIIMREGFFFRHTNETRLATIANVSVNQSLLGQVLDYGTVIIHAFGGDSDPFMQIAGPNAFQKALQAQLDKVSTR